MPPRTRRTAPSPTQVTAGSEPPTERPAEPPAITRRPAQSILDIQPGMDVEVHINTAGRGLRSYTGRVVAVSPRRFDLDNGRTFVMGAGVSVDIVEGTS